MKKTFSQSEENYLKVIFKLSFNKTSLVSTNSIASALKTAAASVTEMVSKLSQKGMLDYERYKGVKLTKEGSIVAKMLVRNHRLWESFLVDKLHYSWDEVHEIAEQLEHVKSQTLIDRLEEFLGFPKFDPHGDPIPDKNGKITMKEDVPLIQLLTGDIGVITGVKEHTKAFLKYLDQFGLVLGTNIQVLDKYEYDNSVKIRINDQVEQVVSEKVGQQIRIQKI